MRRSKLEVNVDILKALAENGKMRPTHLTYSTFLNNKSVNESLQFLKGKNLVEIKGEKRKKYEITSLGLESLELAKKINASLQVFKGLTQ